MQVSFSPPNQLTLLRIILTPVFVVFLFSPSPLLQRLSVLVFIVALLTDWYDGWVARRWGYASRWGAFLDPLADKVLSSAAFVSFIYLDLTPAWPIWLMVVRDISITLLRSYSEYKGRAFVTRKLAKTKTFLQFTLLFYLLLLFVAARTPSLLARWQETIALLLDPALVTVLTVLVAALTIWTGVVYLIENRKTIRALYAVPDRAPQSE
jgi:CDP-diacylglycerol--glycerol-3-phosphate 3-phosphatidyltransferase